MSFWTSSKFQPNFTNKFLVTINGLEGGGQFLVRSVEPLPSYNTEVIGGDLNQDGTGYDTIKKQSRIKWQPITISFVDDVNEVADQSVLHRFFQVLYESGYNPAPAAEDATEPAPTDIPSILINNQSAYNKILGVTIDMLQPNGYTIAQFELIDPVLAGVSVSGVSYDRDDIHSLDVTFEYSHIQYKSFTYNK